METINQILARELNREQSHIDNVIKLLDEGNTIPFIARYRKEMHGAMDDTALRTLAERLAYLRALAERRETVKNSITEQGKMTDELSVAIDEAETLAALEDLYRPYKPKRRTRATIAKEKGLEPLARELFSQRPDLSAPETLAEAFVDPEKGVETVEDALAGASDIIAEQISDDAEIRKKLRGFIESNAFLVSKAATEEDSVYRLYYDFRQRVDRVQGHQILAINRGEKEGRLKAGIELDREAALQRVRRAAVNPGSAAMGFVRAAADDAYDRLIWPSMEREERSALTDMACEGAIKMFALNLKPLLMQPPVRGKVTMGLDPGYRNGCKVAVVDGTGKVLDTAVVYPTFSESRRRDAIRTLSALIRKHGVEHIAIGNGTASRETEQMTVEMLHGLGGGQSYAIVNEAGASVYSASKLAAEEFPQIRCVHCAAASGPAGGACEDRSHGHRGGTVPARYAAGQARRDAHGSCRGLRERRRRGYKHCLAVASSARVRPDEDHGKEHRRIPRGKRRFHEPQPDKQGAEARPQGFPAVRGLPARTGEQAGARQYRRSPGEL